MCAEVLCYSILENVKHLQSSFRLVNTILRKFVPACLSVVLLQITRKSHSMCRICVLQTCNSLENGEYRIMVIFSSVYVCVIPGTICEIRNSGIITH